MRASQKKFHAILDFRYKIKMVPFMSGGSGLSEMSPWDQAMLSKACSTALHGGHRFHNVEG
jgi:hypothetical protein